MREKTGYYDRNGKAIRDGDKIKVISSGQIYKGFVGAADASTDNWNYDGWYFYADCYRRFRFPIADADDIEILEGGD